MLDCWLVCLLICVFVDLFFVAILWTQLWDKAENWIWKERFCWKSSNINCSVHGFGKNIWFQKSRSNQMPYKDQIKSIMLLTCAPISELPSKLWPMALVHPIHHLYEKLSFLCNKQLNMSNFSLILYTEGICHRQMLHGVWLAFRRWEIEGYA